MSLFVAHSAEGRMSGFDCLADLIINDDGVSACDAGYVCFLCRADIGACPSFPAAQGRSWQCPQVP
jgi:hypothetical protein